MLLGPFETLKRTSPTVLMHNKDIKHPCNNKEPSKMQKHKGKQRLQRLQNMVCDFMHRPPKIAKIANILALTAGIGPRPDKKRKKINKKK